MSQDLKDLKQARPICVAPFRQMLFKPNGQVVPCCFLYNKSFGSIKHNSHREIWINKRFMGLREEFLNGNLKTCKSRVLNNNCYKLYEYLRPVGPSLTSRPEHPVRLDLRLNGTCNLSCTMCDVWSQPRGNYSEANFWSNARSSLFPNLFEVDLLGGEPFIQQDTFKAIREVIKVNPDCRFSFITNANFPLVPKLFQTLDRIILHRIQVSVDSLRPKIYSTIRKKGDLNLLLKNIDILHKYRLDRKQKFILKFSMVVMRTNWIEIPNFISYCRRYDALPEFQFAHYDPSKLHSLKFFNSSERRRFLDLISVWSESYQELSEFKQIALHALR